MNLFEKLMVAYANNKEMPLKGHTRIVFKDEKTGEEKVVADTTNLVTNAVATILAKNWSLVSAFHKLLPLKNLYGGVLCFEDVIAATANNYNPPDDGTNKLVAHAGQSMNDTQSRLRGNPVLSDIVETDTSVKWVWEWDTSHGGDDGSCTISTVCLCPNELGNMGLKPFNNALSCWTPYIIDNNAVSAEAITPTRAQAMRYPISISDDGKTGKCIYWSGASFEEITVRHDWLAFGIMRGSNTFQEVSSRTAAVRNMTNGQIFEDANYYYCYSISTATKVIMDKISKSDFTVTQMDDITVGTNLYTGATAITAWDRLLPKFPFDGKYLYLPTSGGNGFVRINMTNMADQEALTGTVNLNLSNYVVGSGTDTACRPIIINEKLVYGDNYIINGGKLYAHKVSTVPYSTETTNRATYLNTIRKDASVYTYPMCNQAYGNRGQGSVLVGMFLSTINVLEAPVTKLNTVSMRIEYTISET